MVHYNRYTAGDEWPDERPMAATPAGTIRHDRAELHLWPVFLANGHVVLQELPDHREVPDTVSRRIVQSPEPHKSGESERLRRLSGDGRPYLWGLCELCAATMADGVES